MVFCAAILAFVGGTPPGAQSASCDRYAFRGLSVGSRLGAVRAQLGREGMTATVTGPGQGEVTTVEYTAGESRVYVEYDHRIDRRPEARVALLRVALPSGDEAIAALALRLGPPTVGVEALERGLAEGSAVWVDEKCGLVAVLSRRQGSWWAGEGGAGASLQLENLEFVRHGRTRSPEAVAALAETPATMAPLPDTPPVRESFVPPVYPPGLRSSGLLARVTLGVTVRADGSVAGARVLGAQPSGQGFEAAAVDAVKQWRYKPALRAGQPVAAEIPVVIEFQ